MGCSGTSAMLEIKRILIVDDEVVIASSLARIFANEGYDCRAANSVNEAVETVSAWTPHLAIVDVRLREINGVELAIQLREQFPNCEVALFTGIHDLTDLLDAARDAGHTFEVISKPVHPEDLLAIVARKLSGLGDGEFGEGEFSPA